ncbi:MAG: siroheme synthase [Alphaproteobacteria bacterium CG11_big_fil_rev_8_21_14_0_20_39_49]|nr:MAG: siroheme synthase [Alphaproteobacteria bacterium CG11_big_fil_rev_8_21_14_0_20_39_49]
MFPIILDLTNMNIALVGGGEVALQRLREMDTAGVRYVRAFADNFGKEFWDTAGDRLTTRMPNEEELKKFQAVVIVDVPMDTATKIAKMAKNAGVMVNAEDNKYISDFFYPSILRRGDLVITVNTTGRCHVLSQRIKNIISKIFHKGWTDKVEEIALKRAQWGDIGLNRKEIDEMSDKYISEKGWLDYEELAGTKEET